MVGAKLFPLFQAAVILDPPSGMRQTYLWVRWLVSTVGKPVTTHKCFLFLFEISVDLVIISSDFITKKLFYMSELT